MPYNVTEEIADLKENVNDFFLLANAIFVSFMQAGFACLEAGAVRTKNATNIIMKNLLDLFICCLAYYMVGYALAYGQGNPFLGYSFWAGIGLPDSKLSHWFFQFVFAATAATILSGAVAERCNFVAYIVYSAVISGVVYPIVSHWAWTDDGWLNTFGYKDFAGCGVVHALAGVCAFVGAAFLGPRRGRFSQDGKPQNIAGHSLPLVGIGALLLISGFLAFNGGSLGHIAGKGDGIKVARSMFSTVVGGSGGAIVCLILGRMGLLSDAPWPFSVTLNGTLAGMVSICGAPDVYAAWAAFVTGGVGALVFLGLRRLVLLVRVDDPLEATAVHLGGGSWGVIARPLFAPDGLVYQTTYDATMGLYQNAVGLCAIIAWSAMCSIIIFGGLKLIGFLRISAEEELEGLDITKHGEHAYPQSAWRESGLWSSTIMTDAIVLDGTYKMQKNDYDNHAYSGDKKNHNVRL
uniref:Ammonium transporter n=2 Tax=Lygus hesperus TaxID=30085 RepID=A0A146LL84_LYGHE